MLYLRAVWLFIMIGLPVFIIPNQDILILRIQVLAGTLTPMHIFFTVPYVKQHLCCILLSVKPLKFAGNPFCS